MPLYIEDLTLDELKTIFVAFLERTQVAGPPELRERIWQEFLAELQSAVSLVERA